MRHVCFLNCSQIKASPCWLARFKKFDDHIYDGLLDSKNGINTADNSPNTCSNSSKDETNSGKTHPSFPWWGSTGFDKQMKDNKLL